MKPVRTVSFTASRDLDPAGERVIACILARWIPPALRYVTGACEGGDAFTGRWLLDHRPAAGHVVIVPANRSRVDDWWAGDPRVTVIEMPPGTAYRDRNAHIVAGTDVLVGFPAHPEDDPRSRRSGTWQTIRMARRAGIPVQWHCVKPPYPSRIETPDAAERIFRR